MKAEAVRLSSDLVLGNTNYGKVLASETALPDGGTVASVELLPCGWVAIEMTVKGSDHPTRVAIPPQGVARLYGLERPKRKAASE